MSTARSLKDETKFLKHQCIKVPIFTFKGVYFLSKALKICLIQRCLKEKYISTSGSNYIIHNTFLSFLTVPAAFGTSNCTYIEVNDMGKVFIRK